MRDRWLTWLLALVIVLAGTTLATAPYFGIGGAHGVPDPSGTLLDFKPTYGALLIAAGATLAILGVAAVGLRLGALALAVTGVAFLAGASLGVVTYTFDIKGITEQSWAILELGGRGPWQAAMASLVAFFASLGLLLTLASSRVDAFMEAQRRNRFDQYRRGPTEPRPEL